MSNSNYEFIHARVNGSYVVNFAEGIVSNNGLYYVPNDEEHINIYKKIDTYAKEHPEVVCWVLNKENIDLLRKCNTSEEINDLLNSWGISKN